MQIRDRIEALRAEMRAKGLSAYFVPSTDAHQSEYVPACWQRRPWISGFTGSAGDVLVTLDGAGLWTDGRYFLQAENELKGTGIDLFRMGMPGVPTVEEFVASTLRAGDALGVDPRVLSVARARGLEDAAQRAGAKMKSIQTNLVDRIWKGQPRPPRDPVRLHPTRYAGETVRSKLKRIRREMVQAGCDAHVQSTLDAIMWTTNLRGTDVDYNPVAISYLLIEADSATLFLDPRKVPEKVAKVLGKDLQLRPYNDFAKALRALAKAQRKVWVDEGTASRWMIDRLKGATLHRAASPIVAMKARKNEVEMQGMREAHERDGAAMVRFLHWLEGAVPQGGVTEIGAADRLEAIRAEGDLFQGLSFNTISGYAAHGAIIHYAVDEKSDVPLRPEGIFLLDSGAQYLDGTTDITRTMLLGKKATKEQRDRFTRVLMGHIDLAMVRFPSGVRGLRLDTLARMPLWQAGLDYQHGTGHGVGSHLNVHEGPQSIGPRCSGAALEVGNVLSNEPGYYEAGAYGIRTENLVLVVEDEKLTRNGTRFHRFETLTLCPIDTRLVTPSLMRDDQRRWLNDYHRRVKKVLSPHLDAAERRWLRERCAAI